MTPQEAMRKAVEALTDEKLTEIYKKANGEDTGKAQALTTQRIFRAMRATALSALTQVRAEDERSKGVQVAPAPKPDSWLYGAPGPIAPLHPELRQSIGEALTEKLAELAPVGEDGAPDWFDSRNVDAVIDTVQGCIERWQEAQAENAGGVPAFDPDKHNESSHPLGVPRLDQPQEKNHG